MAERSDPTPSISSSVTETETFDDNEKHDALGSPDGSYPKLKSPDELDIGDDIERAELLPQNEQEKAQAAPDNSTRSAIIWMVVNTLATIGIVRSTLLS